MGSLHHQPLSKLIQFALVVAAITIFSIYVVYQARFLIIGPVVSLSSEPSVVQSERTLTLAGRAQNITAITLNDRAITTDEAGYFSEPVVLENGYTIVSIAVKDRYGREAVTERTFVYLPQSTL